MKKQPKPKVKDQWWCEACGQHRVNRFADSTDVYTAIEELRTAHRVVSPKCSSTVMELRIIRGRKRREPTR